MWNGKDKIEKTKIINYKIKFTMRKLSLFIGLFLINFSLLALNPSRTYEYTPADFGINFEEVSIKTDDNLTLKGWMFLPEKTSYEMVIISHDGDGNMGDVIELASQFMSMGYNVLTYDYRGYGESDDFEIKNKFFIYSQFATDITAAIDYVKKYHSKCRKVFLYGKGVGAGLSIGVGTQKSVITKIIADSPYSTLEDIKEKFASTGKEYLLPLGFNKYSLEPLHALESKKGALSGILFIVGKDEDVFDVKTVKELSKIRSGISQLHIVKDATYKTTFSKDKNEYFEVIKEFL
jgi:uncharacterized protein